MVKKAVFAALALTVFIQSPAHAISEKHRQQLERSGCTQQSELQGCDIHKSRQQNARAGFSDKTMAGASKATTAGKTVIQTPAAQHAPNKAKSPLRFP
ncbi:hypothetical protein VRB95_12760 [Erwinia aphidicola]|uniref:hypothetical protein n=1 Tax=Erwinia aphidicola TaxID=68334 RepID=UPI0030D4BA2F